MEAKRIEIYDTTLRDGTQGEGVAFAVEDKLRVAALLDELGVDFIEGGWPGANPRDSEFFRRARRELRLGRARLAAFGSTARPGVAAARDENLAALLAAETEVVTLFGKSWTLHVRQALDIGEADNLRLVEASVARLAAEGREVVFDAEHYFDGWSADADYALAVLRAAERGGARRIVLCDTNGGSLPDRIAMATRAAAQAVAVPLGIHAHNDCDLAVANALAAIAAGAMQVQGTFNGWGERCGNANLGSLIPLLELKLGRPTVGLPALRRLTPVARRIAELANLPPPLRLPFVGSSAFAHKGGVHVSAVRKAPETYEHVRPEAVGNRRRVLVSDLAGKANLLAKAAELGLEPLDTAAGGRLAARVKQLEHDGYELESADASLALLLREAAADAAPDAFAPVGFSLRSEFVAGQARSRAEVRLEVGGQGVTAAAEARGPVAALDAALRQALAPHHPELAAVTLTDYKVRILEGHRGTGARVRVLVESSDGEARWTTVGVSDNILEASWEALTAALRYRLARERRAESRG